MDVVQRLVSIFKAYRLAGHDGHHVRDVAATLLLDGDTLPWRIEAAIA